MITKNELEIRSVRTSVLLFIQNENGVCFCTCNKECYDLDLNLIKEH